MKKNKAIKALDDLEFGFFVGTDTKHDYNEDFEIVRKNLTALKLIKNKTIDLINLTACFKFYNGNDEAGLEDYNKTKDNKAELLTQKEYNMLKEVFE